MKSIPLEAFQESEGSNFRTLGQAVVLPEDERIHRLNKA
jgi:hypothetical protein